MRSGLFSFLRTIIYLFFSLDAPCGNETDPKGNNNEMILCKTQLFGFSALAFFRGDPLEADKRSSENSSSSPELSPSLPCSTTVAATCNDSNEALPFASSRDRFFGLSSWSDEAGSSESELLLPLLLPLLSSSTSPSSPSESAAMARPESAEDGDAACALVARNAESLFGSGD